MTLREARDILGLGMHDDPRPLLGKLHAERENLAGMVRSAANETLAMRHQAELVRFDQALAAVRETMEALGLHDSPPASAIEPEAAEDSAPDEDDERARNSSALPILAAVLFLCVGIAGAGFWVYRQNEAQKAKEFEIRISWLHHQGNDHIENRRWEEAGVVFMEIERLVPERPIGRLGLAGIEAGIAEEQSQFISYWTGEARAALDSSRWDDAESAAHMVLERFPGQPDAIAVLKGIADAKLAEARGSAIVAATALLDRGDFKAALAAANALAKAHPGDEAITELGTRARAALDRLQADQARAKALFDKARARDTGEFDAEALEWLREAALLDPHDEAIATHLEKMASYTRTIRVPGDVADLSEAIAGARENDRILLGPGTWEGTFVINLPVDLQGAGPEETILECPAIAGCALTLGPDAKGARISGITFRHIEFDPGNDRYSAALVRGGSVVFADCHFVEASGHGLAVIEGAEVEIQRSRFRENGWNGIAATGEGSVATVSESQIRENFGHGVEAWNGARLVLARCRLEGNTGNGVHIDTAAPGVRIDGCEILANREFGIVLTAVADGQVSKNRVHQNQLGGIAVRQAAAAARFADNEIFANTGPGLLLDRGLTAAAYQGNNVHRNGGTQIMTQADLSPKGGE